MKRPLLVLLALFLFVSMSAPALADNTGARISVGFASGIPGSEVRIPVSVENNPGFAGFAFKVSYDKSSATLTEICKGELLSSQTGGFTANESGGVAMWADAVNTCGDGVLFYLVFTLSARQERGAFEVSVSVKDGHAGNFVTDGNSAVNADFTAGQVSCGIGKTLISAANFSSDKGSVLLTVTDVSPEACGVVLAFYDGIKMASVQMDTRVLTIGQTEIALKYTGKYTYIKVFVLESGTLAPQCPALAIQSN